MEGLSRTAGLFMLLGNRYRLRLLKLLEHGEGYSSELSVVVNLARSTTSMYLNQMATAGLLTIRETRYLVYFSLAPRNTHGGVLARKICSWLDKDKTTAQDLRVLKKERIH